MKLFILRHGKAVKNSENQYDVERDLSAKGFDQIEKIGNFLKKYDIKAILSSSAKRTVSTTEGVNKHLDLDYIVYEDDLYLSDVKTIHHYISKFSVTGDFLFVGHNFGISQLVTYYTGEPINLSTGMLAIVEFEVESPMYFSEDSGRLIDVINPKQL